MGILCIYFYWRGRSGWDLVRLAVPLAAVIYVIQFLAAWGRRRKEEKED